ncbi:MAG: ABC transporter substrate-binding protein [Gammaproteobacteria bacterium]|nr:MAG: ABC transporter substrate-binding protein [Gammaproteobacteria bacterium]
MKKILLMAVLFYTLLGGESAFADAKKRALFVSIPPQKYFVEKVAGGRFAVKILLKEGKSAALYSPDPKQLEELLGSELFFSIGVPYEQRVIRFLEEKNMARVVDAGNGVTKRRMSASPLQNSGDKHRNHKHKHNHNHHGDHEHEDGLDPHIWLDPLLVKIQAQNIAKALIKIDPEGEAIYKKNLQIFNAELDNLHSQIAEKLGSLKGKVVVLFHPSLGYFTDRYGLKQVAIEVEGKPPKGKYLSRIVAFMKVNGIKTILVQSDFGLSSAQRIASAVGAKVEFFNPLDYNYGRNILNIAELIKKGG